MQDLIKQEQFEIELLDKLNSGRLLSPLLFTGGTMLRLCYGLNRFSVDLDFWFIKKVDIKKYFRNCREFLSKEYTVRDAADKHYTLLFEISSKNYPSKLKIEMRKEIRKIPFDESIAFSKYSDKQVLLKTVRLTDFMGFKLEAFLARKEIRDCFDLEFLLKRGIELNAPPEKLKAALKELDSLTVKDYSLKLNSLLDAKERKYYRENNFKLLRIAITSKS